jgi:hypothetical protein
VLSEPLEAAPRPAEPICDSAGTDIDAGGGVGGAGAGTATTGAGVGIGGGAGAVLTTTGAAVIAFVSALTAVIVG